MIALALMVGCVALGVGVYRIRVAISRLRMLNSKLQDQLNEAVRLIDERDQRLREAQRSLAACEGRADAGSVEVDVVEWLASLGVPGLVLLVTVSTSGYAGAAAITSGLAALGGPFFFGMIGGVSVLIVLVPVSGAITRIGMAKLGPAVVRRLLAKGETPESIRNTVRRIPRWILSKKIRIGIEDTLRNPEAAAAAAG